MGASSREFFPGIEQETVRRIFHTLGRCRADWKIETQVIREMEELLPRLQAHRHEWQSVILMARTWNWQRRAAFALLEMDDFFAAHRPVDSEWQRRLDDECNLLGELLHLREEVRGHFSVRYYGQAFEEWLGTLFGMYEERLRQCQMEGSRKLRASREFYSHGPGC